MVEPRYDPVNWTGTTVDDFEFGGLLGRGTFGSVHEARWRGRALPARAPAHVAIKLIDKAHMRSRKMARRLASEVELHAALSHPSIVRLHHHFEDAHRVYLVLELCPRGDLHAYLREHGPLPERAVARVVRHLAGACRYMHDVHRVAHRDLKLANVLLDGDMVPKVADFGLAARCGATGMHDGADDREDVYAHHTMCGTPNFMSPEVATRRPHGLETDLWSMGCIIFALLTGHPPFRERDMRRILDRVSRLDFEVPSSVSPQGADLILRLLQRHPERRPSWSDILQHPFLTQQTPTLRQVPRAAPLAELHSRSSRRSDPEVEHTRRRLAGSLLPSSSTVSDRVLQTLDVLDEGKRPPALPQRVESPRVICTFDRGRGVLRRGGPRADFALELTNGRTIRYSPDQEAFVAEQGSTFSLDSIESELLSCRALEAADLKLALRIFRICLEHNRSIRQGDTLPLRVHDSAFETRRRPRSSVSTYAMPTQPASSSTVSNEDIGQASGMRSGDTIPAVSHPSMKGLVEVSGVGWGLTLPSGELWIQFTDSSQILLSADGASVAFVPNAHGRRQRFDLMQQVPGNVRERIAHVPKFAQLLHSTSS